jgi:hypothetical protein
VALRPTQILLATRIGCTHLHAGKIPFSQRQATRRDPSGPVTAKMFGRKGDPMPAAFKIFRRSLLLFCVLGFLMISALCFAPTILILLEGGFTQKNAFQNTEGGDNQRA